MKAPKQHVTDALRGILVLKSKETSLPADYSARPIQGQPCMRITHKPTRRSIKVNLCDYQGAVQALNWKG